MSRIEELKKQNPKFNIDLIDVLQEICQKSKYTEMLVNLVKNNFTESKDLNQHKKDMIYELNESYGFDLNKLISMSYVEIYNLNTIISDFIGVSNYQSFMKFVSFNEKKMIQNTDLTSYKSFDELELQVSLASLKDIDKEMEKQVLKLYETDEWVVIKPLSYQSSLKYGASTKWCTSSDTNPDYYFRYVKRGILIYCINKKTGDKTAAFKNIDNTYDRETSFWDITDIRVDSLETNLPSEILNIIKKEFSSTTTTNWEILSQDERNSQLLWLESLHSIKKDRITRYVGEIEDDYPILVEEERTFEPEEVPVNRRIRRVIPMPIWSEPTTTADEIGYEFPEQAG